MCKVLIGQFRLGDHHIEEICSSELDEPQFD
jgi:hypothetical protein